MILLRSPLIFTCLIFHTLISAALAANISPGSSLYASTPNQTWSSNNGNFFLGFIAVDPPSYIAAIYYVGGVPIWTAGGPSAAVDARAALHFLSTGNLQLVNGSGITVWNSNTSHLGVNSASLNDSGDLVLRSSNGSVWSSFQNPTDTIVPSQRFETKQVLRSGVYSFSLLDSGNLTLTWNDSVVFWNHDFTSSNFTSPFLQLQQNGILSLSDSNSNGTQIVAYSNDYGEETNALRFLKLDSDGNFRMYSSSRGSGTTGITWSALADSCQVYGYCGNMGICSYVGSDPVCGCPSENFEPIDVNDRNKGCKRKVKLGDCAGNIAMVELKNTKFLTFQDQQVILGITACRSNCLTSSPCIASSSLADGTGYCYLKTSDFVSGYQSPVLPGTSYVKVCAPAQPNPSPSTQFGGKRNCRRQVWAVGSSMMSIIIGLVALVGSCWWWSYRKGPRGVGMWAQYTLVDYASGAPVQFSYKELQRATKGFKEKLGVGGFGAVYRGVLGNGTVVAVKQLEGIEQGEKQFRMEVATISSTHHLNLVRLIGFCSEGRHRLLVYEFMKNGSLQNFLYTTEEQPGYLLNWLDRFNIALGTARGITYLHEECCQCIVHCDIKPENILLDENYNPKVSDFGLAKLVNPKGRRHRSLRSVRGTRGYLAPEWLSNLPITSKSDVYSYGMVLLEIVSGRRNFEVTAETDQTKFSLWAYENFEKGNLEAIVDKRLADQATVMDQVIRAIQVSFWCIQEHPSQRPTMGKVVQMLEGVRNIPRPPAPKVVNEVPIGGTSTTLSSKDSTNFTGGASTDPVFSSSSSFQITGISPLASGKNLERASSALLGTNQSEPHNQN
uniref:Receptor-like serine/threonine-protein kinase n=1 Tax=Rhizophora mucronata TaxID=61149 RepID=A0A2P2JY89_RHIMU